MKTRKFILFLGFTSVCMLGGALSSCEKSILDEEEQSSGQSGKSQKTGKTDVLLRVAQIEDTDFVITDFNYVASSEKNGAGSRSKKRAMTDLTTYCTRLNYVIFKDGKKIESRSQLKGDTGYGEVSIPLVAGSYQLLVLAHSSTGGNPTITDPEKIQFTNALNYSDTFSFYGNLEVTSEAKTHDIVLTRNVSCLRFTVEDEFPENVKYMKFYYTGGSGVLNAVTGYGALVNSQQEKRVNIQGLSTPLTFNLYTFMQEDEGFLQLRVQALQADGETVVHERTFENVPMKYQKLTSYRGSFFYKNNGFSLTAETDWGDPYQEVDY